VPETVTIDKSDANLAALHAVNAERDTPIKIRQVKYLNNIVEQDHRAIKRIIRPMLGFKDFRCALVILSGIEIMHMISKGLMKHADKIKPSATSQLYSLVMQGILIILPLYDSITLLRQNHPKKGAPN
jgi:transposase-like protein